MFTIIATVILYVFGFVFLYGVIRLAVRHGMEDLEARRPQVLRVAQSASADDRAFMRENAFLSGS
ncbi:hypothetical protein ACFT9M_23905 [Micromonospora purpureochromogenes]|uniref:hypothetical protein n=1 Tax=Micromonospora TaxID=1873 RepID=UPI001A62024B|nr:hypothetical protein [Micromonospora sp. 4G55]MBM0258020.1 hypothetical protein [Micromonospora sp. 4G55]MBM0258798.1 hypothetical protein [Micromonospora sp. 4G55]